MIAPRWRWSALSLNQKLAMGAATLGLVSLGAHPYRGNIATVDVKELAILIDRENDHVTAGDLAAWIVAGRADYRLVDLRTDKEFAEYHIPTAEHVALSSLADASLQPDEKIVLYSDGGIHASQAWMLMRARGFRTVYSLKGGLESWRDEVLFPATSADATPPERARFERAAAMARFFGGSPRTGGNGAAALPALAMPKIEPPVAAAGGPPVAKKKKKEGC